MKNIKITSRLIAFLLILSLLTACTKKEEIKTDLSEEEKIVEEIETEREEKEDLNENSEDQEELVEEEAEEEIKFQDLYGIWTCIKLPEEYNSEEFLEEFRIRIDPEEFHFYAYRTSFVNHGPYEVLDFDDETKTFTIKVREESVTSLDYFNENQDYYYNEDNFKNFQVGETYEETEEIQIFFDQEYKIQLLADGNLSLQRPDEGAFIFEYHHSLDEGEFY